MTEISISFILAFGVFIGITMLHACRGEFLKGVAIGGMASVFAFLLDCFLTFCFTYKS
jgi:hypothetical protein